MTADEINRAVGAERMRWARLVQKWGYPFDFTNSGSIPEPDMLDAIALAWMEDPAGYPDSGYERAQADVYEEVGVLVSPVSVP